MRLALMLCLACVFAIPAQAARTAGKEFAIGVKHVTYVDETRGIRKSVGFAGSPTRRIDVIVWYPTEGIAGRPSENAAAATGGPWPLIIYSHGTFGHPDNATHIVYDLVRHGYVVAAPNYPLTSSTAFTHINAPDISDVAEQVKDVHFVIDRLLADPQLAPMIDKDEIGTTGHSLGAITSYFASFGLQTRDPRIKATAPIAAGDPVQSALSSDMGLLGTGYAAVSVPVLFLSAEKDVFARTTGQPHAAYMRLEKPKYEVMVRRGVHVWFRDNNEQPADNRNPDCLFFDQWMPGVAMPGCEERVPLIGPKKQQEITRIALRDFFDAYLKHDAAALGRLHGLGKQFDAVDLMYED